MKKNNIDYIIFAIKQIIEAEKFGFTRNECRGNLATALHQYWQNKIMGLHGTAHRKLIVRSKAAIIAEKKQTERTEVEHSVPVNKIIDMLLDLKKINSKEAESILKKYYRVYVVTVSEHKKLSNLKLRSKMPDDWDYKDPYVRYKKAGIKI